MKRKVKMDLDMTRFFTFLNVDAQKQNFRQKKRTALATEEMHFD